MGGKMVGGRTAGWKRWNQTLRQRPRTGRKEKNRRTGKKNFSFLRLAREAISHPAMDDPRGEGRGEKGEKPPYKVVCAKETDSTVTEAVMVIPPPSPNRSQDPGGNLYGGTVGGNESQGFAYEAGPSGGSHTSNRPCRFGGRRRLWPAKEMFPIYGPMDMLLLIFLSEKELFLPKIKKNADFRFLAQQSYGGNQTLRPHHSVHTIENCHLRNSPINAEFTISLLEHGGFSPGNRKRA